MTGEQIRASQSRHTSIEAAREALTLDELGKFIEHARAVGLPGSTAVQISGTSSVGVFTGWATVKRASVSDSRPLEPLPTAGDGS